MAAKNKGGRPTAAVIAERKDFARKQAAYDAQESRRAPRVQIDQKITMYVLLTIGGLIFAATALLVADGTIGSASAARYEIWWFAYLMFFTTEAAVLGFLLIYYMVGSRVDDVTGRLLPAGRWFVASVAASVIAAALSTYHVFRLYDYDLTSIDMWVGAAIRLTTTVFFVVISKGLANVIFAKAIRA